MHQMQTLRSCPALPLIALIRVRLKVELKILGLKMFEQACLLRILNVLMITLLYLTPD